MKNKFTSLLLIVTIASMSLGPMTGCSSSTQITSDPAGAEALVDGQPVGQTPVQFSEGSVWLWTKHQVTLKKKGYEQYTGQMAAGINTPMLVFGIICGLFTLCGFAFITIGEYKPVYHYVLNKKEASEMVQAWFAKPSVSFSE